MLLENAAYNPYFSGHETFPLRQIWLSKVMDHANSNKIIPKSVFSDDDAIARFGVGKNMVSSMRHWALACAIMEESKNQYLVTEIGDAIFSKDGLDPYSEKSTTPWYVHWCLAGRGNRATTWFWLFNCVSAQSFSRDDLVDPLMKYARNKGVKLSPMTLTRDIEACLRSYAPRTENTCLEDYAEPMLGELGLIQDEGKGYFSFRRGSKTTLPDGLFAFALFDYWDLMSGSESTLAFESIAYGAGSPGRVFKLDEDSVAERLFGLEEITQGVMTWSDTAGLRQVLRKPCDGNRLKLELLRKAYV